MTGTSSSSSHFSESEDEDEDEDEDGDKGDSVTCCFIRGALLTRVFFWISDSSDEESRDSDDDDDDAWRRLRFLLRLRGAVALAVGIWWC